MYLSLYCKSSKRVTQGFTVRGSWRPNRTAIYWPPLLWPSVLCLSCSPVLLNRRPGGSAFCWVLVFSTTSYHQRVSKTTGGPTLLTSNSIGGPEGPFGLVWLSLPHLVSNSVYFLSSPSYIIVQSPTQSPTQSLEWHVWSSSSRNNCHMQFKGHSLPVHQSMSVSWAFTLSHFVSQIHLRVFFRLLAIGMCHFLLVHHFGMVCFGRVEGQYTTYTARLSLSFYESFFNQILSWTWLCVFFSSI